MKFIRFENEIMEVEDDRGLAIKTTFGENIIKLNEELIIVKNNEGNILIPTEKIIKQADTIEELCDEFVAVGVPFKTFVIEKSLYEEQGNTLEEYVHYLYIQYTNVVVYGAIWTDNGLIYVAKMNKKGELELL